jgi:hypothetical protein
MELGTIIRISQKDSNGNYIEVDAEYMDSIMDIRTITVPAQQGYSEKIEYHVVTKYLVRRLSDNAMFTLYTNQVKGFVSLPPLNY